MNIDFPFHFDRQGRTADCDDSDHVRDMLTQLLKTSPGERVNRPDFGSGLGHYCFETNRLEQAAGMQISIAADLQRHLGEPLEVQDLNVEAVDASLRVAIDYALRVTGESRQEVIEHNAPS
ncbi:MAG: GPW/gp25 family protein [Planctomycetota bacterium]